MEKKLKPYEREHMKIAMLKHEETFKQQVNELHRLYRIQKTLMKGVEHNKPKRPNHQGLNGSFEDQTIKNPSNFHQNSKLRFVEESKRDKELEIEDESEIQLTLGPTRYKKTETSDSGLSFSSSSTGSSHVIKGGHQGAQQNQENLAWGLTMLTTDSNSGYHTAKKSGYHVQDKPNQGRLDQPPWLLQALSNMS